ncbi:hypothetical protein SCHPADRAFT_416689 [Schizopora paradoxa]|uniref:Uncharacterized protein n=1 Tax=Schizopora paradoxa TaxID=27342 RepID=A0A0H2RKF5_9AGAM|nr:hypothetical protein SCHPADRAFT_416689 [Schizopora paradoxa]
MEGRGELGTTDFGFQQGSSDPIVAIEKLRNEVNELKETMAQQERRHADERKADRDDFDKKISALTWSVGHTQQLTALVVDYYPPDSDIVMQNRLQEVRTCVAEGFKTLFPDMFTREPRDILDAYNPDPADKTAIHQTRSAFDSCNREALLNFHGIYKHRPAEEISDPSPDPTVFERLHANDLDGETMRPHVFSINDFTGFQLRFYIPVFIWAYNEVKRCLLPERQRFESISRLLDRQLRYLKTLEGKPEMVISLNPPEDGTLRLDLGVALEVRKGRFCKEYLGIATMETQEVGRGETKGEILAGDDQGDIPMDDVASTDMSTKRKRVTFSLLGEEDAPRPTRRPRVGSDSSFPALKNPEPTLISYPSRPKSSVQKQAVAEPEFVELPYRQAKAAMLKEHKEYESALKRLSPYLRKLTPIRKCLTILLDANLLNFVLHGTLSFRETQGKLVKRNVAFDHTVNADMDAALFRVQDVAEVQEKRKKLLDLLDDKDIYRREDSLERAIDEYVDGELKAAQASSALRHTKTDLYILLSWLEAAYPNNRGGVDGGR